MKTRVSRHRLLALVVAIIAVLALGTAASAQIGVGPFTSNPIPAAPAQTALPSPDTATSSHSNPMSALVTLSWQARATGGNVPGGCATVNGTRYCAPRVTIDGKKAPDVPLISSLVGLTTSSGGPHGFPAQAPVGSSLATHEAVTQVVLNQLLAAQAEKDGAAATTADARTEAQSVLAGYQQMLKDDPAQAATVLPAGVDARAFFTSSGTVEDYRLALSIGNERRKLESAAGVVSSGPQTAPQSQRAQQDRAVLSSFLSQQLPAHTVTVNGAPPSFDLSHSLPATP
ncbi:MAG: hypothetical protein ACRDFX_06165 [Chloroflexota bacterium]